MARVWQSYQRGTETMRSISVSVAHSFRPRPAFAASILPLYLWVVTGALCLLGPLAAPLEAQNYLTSTGTPSFAAPYPAEMGIVDAASGNLHLEIPLQSFPQRGRETFTLQLEYDSHIWSIQPNGAGFSWWPAYYPGYLANGGWRTSDPSTWLTPQSLQSPQCTFDQLLLSPNGTPHWFRIAFGGNGNLGSCTSTATSAYATDSSGILLKATYSNQHLLFTAYAPDGTMLVIQGSGSTATNYPEDSNGNYMYLGGGSTDTLGRQVLQLPISPPSCVSAGYYACYDVLNSQGATSRYSLTWAQIPLKTNFGVSGVVECTTNCSTTVLTGITLPDGSSYSFLYDCDKTTGNSACNSSGGLSAYYGTLASMTLPSGGTVTYGYSTYTDAGGGRSRWLTSKCSVSGCWSYTPTAVNLATQTVRVNKPDNSKEVTTFTLNNGAWPTQIVTYDTDSVTVLSTVNNTWDFSIQCTLNLCLANPPFGAQDVRKLSTTTTVPVAGGSSITKKTAFTYDTPQTANITGVKEWKYQPGASPTFSSVPDRATYVTYATIGTNNNINRPTTITSCNNVGTSSTCTGGGTPVAQTTITYDGYGSNGSLPLQSITGVVNHDDTNYGGSYLARGNPTQVSKWLGGSSYLTTAYSYDTTGQVIKIVDPNGNPVTYSYADVFFDDNGADPPPAHSGAPTTNAYVTMVTDAIGSTSIGYYYGTGRTAQSTDYNGVKTYRHYIDPLDRPTKTDLPIGWVLNQYSAPTQGQTEVDSYAAVGDTNPTGSASCTLCTHTQTLLDQLGRAVTGSLVNNPAGQVTVQSVYDSLNRVNSSSHPNFGATDPNNVYENALYDGLGRTTRVTHPDGQSASVAYGASISSFGGLTSQQGSAATYGYGFPVVTVDEAGKARQEWIDGFGHVVEVDEPGGDATFTSSTGSYAINMLALQYTDRGTITAYVNGTPVASASFAPGQPGYTIAQALSTSINGNPSVPVTSTWVNSGGNGTVNLTSKTKGVDTNYPLSINCTLSTGSSCSSRVGASGMFGGTTNRFPSPLATMYTYDALGNLTKITQGVQTRTYQYDSLSRLTQEITPEAGKVTLSYGAPGSLCSGNPSQLCSKTAPAPNQTGTATVTTTYTYNSANQLTQKTHSDTTGTEVYTYGTSAASFNVGRLVSMTDPSGSEGYTYDKMGRLIQVNKTIGSANYTTQYVYNPGGELTKITYPSGRVVYYNYDNVGHLCQVATSASSTCSAASPYLNLPSGSYDASGRSLSATYGNGVVATAAYSPQTFELASLSYTKGTTTLFGLNYYYQQNSTFCPTGNATGNNGQIQCIADISSGTGAAGRSVSYTYDSLGRLLTAKTTGSTQYPLWGLSWTYDRYANRTAQTVTAGSGYNVALSINAVNNQITGYTYDATGNITASPSNAATFVYDGEECNTGYTGNGNAATYTCDGNHLRVKKVVTGTNAVTTVYVRSGGDVLAEYDNSAAGNSPTREYLYGNNLLATVTGSIGGSGGTITYQHYDHLSPRLFTDANGNNVAEEGTYPFGESWYNNSGTNNWVFTSYERDAESGNDYALARDYASTQGRFLSPDPLQGVVGDPQSWNRYAYVENDPINLSDPSGAGFWSDLANFFVELFTAFQFSPNDGSNFAGDPQGPCTSADGCSYTRMITDAALLLCPGGPCVFGNGNGGGENRGPGTNGTSPESTGGNPDGGDPSSQGPGNGGAGASDPSPTPGGSGGSAGGGSAGGGSAGGGTPTGGGIWNELKYASVPCLGCMAIRWSLTHNSPHGGWIVQHVQAQNAQGVVLMNYWEAWQVAPHKRLATPTVDGVNDFFGTGWPSGTRVMTQARFYEGLTTPRSWNSGWNTPGAEAAGSLKAIATNPHLPTSQATRANRRYWVAP